MLKRLQMIMESKKRNFETLNCVQNQIYNKQLLGDYQCIYILMFLTQQKFIRRDVILKQFVLQKRKKEEYKNFQWITCKNFYCVLLLGKRHKFLCVVFFFKLYSVAISKSACIGQLYGTINYKIDVSKLVNMTLIVQLRNLWLCPNNQYLYRKVDNNELICCLGIQVKKDGC
eukprot:TRINITY_DN299_c0_g1_i2.p2 TRINITY_DN299_c0_g1~~TRINITY_DN299_c0_g1_i2.p2  ORF type:complete len:172 (-),score=1.17 TRINITY_DN299_c0_g1_i2:203-718(-)